MRLQQANPLETQRPRPDGSLQRPVSGGDRSPATIVCKSRRHKTREFHIERGASARRRKKWNRLCKSTLPVPLGMMFAARFMQGKLAGKALPFGVPWDLLGDHFRIVIIGFARRPP